MNIWTDLIPDGWPEQIFWIKAAAEDVDLLNLSADLDFAPLREVTPADTARSDLDLTTTRWLVNESRFSQFAAGENCHTIFCIEIRADEVTITNSYGPQEPGHGGVHDLIVLLGTQAPALRYGAVAMDPGSGDRSALLEGSLGDLAARVLASR